VSGRRTRVLTFRYVGALLAVAAFLIAEQFVVQAALDRQEGDARVVNIAGRQRMLSQRLSMLMLALEADGRNDATVAALSQVADEWEHSHIALQQLSNSSVIRELFAQIDSDHRAMLAAARSVTASPSVVLAHQDAFLAGMDRIVAQYEREARQRVVELRRTELVLLLLVLGVLGLEGLFVFRPAVKGLRAHLAERDRAQRELLTVSDREQRRIAEDIHDGLSQQLVGVSYLVKSLASTDPRVAEIGRLLGESIDHTRGLTRSLYSPILELEGLVPALRDLAAYTERAFRVDCHVHAEPIELPMPQRGEIYRIAREAVINAGKHSRATSIEIELERSSSTLVLTIRDDGVGMSRNHAGLGLHLMESRANMLGATLAISPGEPRGTVVTCTIPLTEHQA